MGTNINSWLDSLTKPVHDGYSFSGYEITAGTIDSVVEDATVYIKYTQSGGDTKIVTTYLNGDGDINIDGTQLIESGLVGSADIEVTLGKAIVQGTDYVTSNVMEFNGNTDITGDTGSKSNVVFNGNKINFTDVNVPTHNFYTIQLFDANNQRTGTTVFNGGAVPNHIKFTIGEAVFEYNIKTN